MGVLILELLQSLTRALVKVFCTSHKSQNHKYTSWIIILQVDVVESGQAPQCMQFQGWT